MYNLFYMGYMLFGGLTAIMGGVQVINTIRRREEMHQLHVADARYDGYWTGVANTWPVAYRQGEESALQICQLLAMESADMIGMDEYSRQEFGQLVQSWPSYVLTPTDDLVST